MVPKQKIFDLRQQGLSQVEISKQLNVHRSTVDWTIKHPHVPAREDGYNWKDVQEYYDDGHTVKETIKYFGMSSASWDKAIKRGAVVSRKRAVLSLQELLVEDRPTTNRAQLKKLLLKDGVLEEVCAECGIGSTWNNKKLILQLEHKNGKNKDNRLENLCLLCPNCHSQTPTFAGKNCLTTRPNFCIDCNKSIQKKSIRCVDCANAINRSNFIKKVNKTGHDTKPSPRKVVRPSKEELEKMLWEMPTTSIAKIYDVSDKAVEKWAK